MSLFARLLVDQASVVDDLTMNLTYSTDGQYFT